MFTAQSLELDLGRITESVFDSMLGIEITPEHDAAIAAGARVTGVVSVTGAWQGAIMVSCSHDGARRIASTMFGTEPAATTDGEINDAMGEMANMIGGNFKSMLEPPVALSLPTVTQGSSFKVNMPGCRELGSYSYRAGDDVVTVSVVERV
jgi:chemotaxis protein CheX